MNEKKELVNKLYTLRACLSYISQLADTCRACSDIINQNNNKTRLMESNIRQTQMSIDNSEKLVKDTERDIRVLKNNNNLFYMKKDFFIGLGLITLSIIIFFVNRYLKANYVFPGWDKTLSIVALVVTGFSLVFGVLKIYKAIKNSIRDNKEKKREIMSKGNLVFELKRTIESTKIKLKGQTAEYNVNKKVLEFNNDKQYKIINEKTKLAQSVYNEIKNQMYGILSQSDWKHLDIIIYYLNTGRADTIKEALQQLDRHLQTQTIVNEIKSATRNITSEIKAMKVDIKAAINNCASVISRQIRLSSEQTNKIINEKMSEVIEIQEDILTQRELQNALIEKHNQTSQALVDECRNLRLSL